MADNNLENVITDAAAAPKKLVGDQGTVEQHSIKELIEADRYLAAKNAAKSKTFGIRFIKLRGPGAIG